MQSVCICFYWVNFNFRLKKKYCSRIKYFTLGLKRCLFWLDEIMEISKMAFSHWPPIANENTGRSSLSDHDCWLNGHQIDEVSLRQMDQWCQMGYLVATWVTSYCFGYQKPQNSKNKKILKLHQICDTMPQTQFF